MPEPNQTHDPAEEILIRAVRNGELSAFESLLDEHLDSLRAFVGLRLPIAHLIDEISHETFVFAYRNIHRFQAGTSFRNWLRAIATNLIRAEIQRYHRDRSNRLGYARQRLLESSLSHDVPGKEGDDVGFLKDCLEELPAPMTQLVDRKYRKEMPIAEIAALMGRSQNAVWQALFRLRHQLRQCMERKLEQSAP